MHRIQLAAAAIGAAALGCALAAGPAQAASLYLYAEPNYKALIGTFTSAMASPHNMSTNADDTLSSFNNTTAYSVAFWHEKNGTGYCFTGAPRSKVGSFAFWDDNHVSSFQLGRAC